MLPMFTNQGNTDALGLCHAIFDFLAPYFCLLEYMNVPPMEH
jgi:hypothetical protein